MATERTSSRDGSRARIACAACALIALGGATGVTLDAHASPQYGPIANFGPAIVVDSHRTPSPAPDANLAPAPQADAAAPASESRPLLTGRGRASPATVEGAQTSRGASADSGASWMRVIGALALVVGLIYVLRGVVRRVAARGGLRAQFGVGGRAPSGVLEVLGRYPVSRGQSIVLLRVDQRVLLLGQSSSGFRTLADFSDTGEVASLLVRARDEDSESLSGRFRTMLSKFERDPMMTEGVEHIDLTRRAPLIRRAEARAVPQGASQGGVQRVRTSRDSYEAIRRRLESMQQGAAR